MRKKATRGTGGPKPPDDPEQSRRFEDAARDLGADETGKAFKKAVQKVVPARKRSS
jgi:hypothetical protein